MNVNGKKKKKAAAATRTKDFERENVRMWVKKRTHGTGNKKLRASNPHCHHWHGRERAMWPVVETDGNKHSEGRGGGDVGNMYGLPFGSQNNPHIRPPIAPMPADNPKCPLPPSAPSKKRITTSKDRDYKRIPYSRDAGLEFQHVFVKELKKRNLKKKKTYRCPLFSWADWVTCVWQKGL